MVRVGSRIEVIEIEQDKFRDYQDHLRKLYTEHSKDLDNQPLDFVEAVWFIFGKGETLVDGKLVVFEHPHKVWVHHTYDGHEKPKCVSFIKKRGIQSGFDYLPPPLYDQYPVAIEKSKAEDLRKLVTKYVPAAHQGFYSELPIVDTENDTVTKALCYIHIFYFFFIL